MPYMNNEDEEKSSIFKSKTFNISTIFPWDTTLKNNMKIRRIIYQKL